MPLTVVLEIRWAARAIRAIREFDTTEPLSVVMDAYVGHIRIVATDRAVAVVDVRADNQSRTPAC